MSNVQAEHVRYVNQSQPPSLPAGGQVAVPSPTPPLTSGWGPTAALVSKAQQLTELVAVSELSQSMPYE